MPTRRRVHTLERWEVALVKAMLATGGYNDQDVLAYFTRPTRSVNHRAIAEIRTAAKHRAIRPATDTQLSEFLTHWPDVDPETGLSRRGDELLLKAREAMIAAVHCFNSGGLTFRAELFITTAVIAWTYLLHAFFKREGIDYRYRQAGDVALTPGGGEKYWELGKCLRHARSPVTSGVRLNLEFLLEIRHEIEHRSTNRIDDALGAKLQACCINFNAAIRSLFGSQYGLERRLPLALQFVTFDGDQRTALKAAAGLPANLATTMDAFDGRLNDEQRVDPAFGYRVAFVPKVGSKATNADLAVEFVKPGTDEAREISRVLLKEVDKMRFTATQVVDRMHAEGFTRFTQTSHTSLWRALSAKDPAKGFGRAGDYAGTWVWFDSWLARVRAHCQEQGTRYFPAQGAPTA
ncbi:DUF3644 domain-containing protein [Sphingomonas sp. M6A6_1c]